MLAVAAAMLPSSAPAVVPPELPSELAAKAVRHPALDVRSDLIAGSRLAAGAAGALAALGVPVRSAHLDLATGRWASLLPAAPMIPGTGNELAWTDLGPPPPRTDRERGEVAWHALAGWIEHHAEALGLDPAELAPPAVTVHDGGALIQVSGRRVLGGVPVRDCTWTAAIAHGNLVLFGTRNWGEPGAATIPALAPGDAQAALAAHLGPLMAGRGRRPHLELVPVSGAGPGSGRLGYRLVWVLHPELRADLRAVLAAEWEALVDAASGEILSFADTAHYLTAGAPAVRGVIGGHLPRTNDGVPPGGVEKAGAPVPYADLEDDRGVIRFADGGGNLLACVEGTLTSRLQGLLVSVDDQCGAVAESTADAVLDLGTNAGTDCATPPGGSPGNTRAARIAYYELSRTKEIARGQLPGNDWLGQRLPVETNVNLSCGASWNGTAVRTFRQSPGGAGCTNTGEIASVLDHEWGHGMDQFGANPGISNPSEGIADVYAALRQHDSCIGPNFRTGIQCSGYGDPCTACTGVRDLDWALHASAAPHDLAWADASCGNGPAPCGGGVHCEGTIYAEAIWDLYRRDLQGFAGSAFDFDDDTAAEIVTRLTFLGGGLVGGWFDCLPGSAGCAADTGYLNFLAADDDDGDLANGTPHMSAIFAAFDRHGIACATPVVADSGCAGTPADPPAVAVQPADRAVRLTWDPDAGASGYAVFRAEGPFGCDIGKLRLGETAGTEWYDLGLQNGRTYSYVVIPKGPSPSCFGNGSACTPATPVAGGRLAACAVFADGFESGDTTAWTTSTP